MLSIVETKDFSAYTEILAGLSLPADFHLTEVTEEGRDLCAAGRP